MRSWPVSTNSRETGAVSKLSLNRRNVLSMLGALPVISGFSLRTDAALAQRAASATPLPSWNDGATKQSIFDFVAAVTSEGSPDFIPPAERIATFDNDGTLWVEKRGPGRSRLVRMER